MSSPPTVHSFTTRLTGFLCLRPQETIPKTTIVQSRFLDLLKKLLTWDPAQRITVREALRHPFFALKIEDEGSEFL
jgi:serine/threonine protein kinase